MISFAIPLRSFPPVRYIRCVVDADIGFLWTGLIVWPYKNYNIRYWIYLFGKELDSLIHLLSPAYHRQAPSPVF